MGSREFLNELQDYNGTSWIDDKGKIQPKLRDRLLQEIDKQLDNLYHGLESWLDWNDYSVYTGTSGIALLHLHLHNTIDHGQSDKYLQKALTYVEKPLRNLKRRKPSFLCGDAGPLAIGAVLYHKLGKISERDKCLKGLANLHKDVLSDESMPDELLNGRTGYISALLFVQKHIGPDAVDVTIINKVYARVLESGEALSREQRSRAPLMYEWHDKKYLGAAHGITGLLTILMQIDDPQHKENLDKLIKPTIDFLITLRFPSGNFPSSMESSNGDKLVHWCHGAPGWIHMFIWAYKVFGDDKYLVEAKSCGEVVWKRGLLKKGYGICHGVAGNAYAFLTLYKLTGDQLYLHRAVKFAEWCFDYGKHGCRTPDRPMSLFEGLAGTIYFLTDLLHPAKSKFPAFEF